MPRKVSKCSGCLRSVASTKRKEWSLGKLDRAMLHLHNPDTNIYLCPSCKPLCTSFLVNVTIRDGCKTMEHEAQERRSMEFVLGKDEKDVADAPNKTFEKSPPTPTPNPLHPADWSRFPRPEQKPLKQFSLEDVVNGNSVVLPCTGVEFILTRILLGSCSCVLEYHSRLGGAHIASDAKGMTREGSLCMAQKKIKKKIYVNVYPDPFGYNGYKLVSHLTANRASDTAGELAVAVAQEIEIEEEE